MGRFATIGPGGQWGDQMLCSSQTPAVARSARSDLGRVICGLGGQRCVSLAQPAALHSQTPCDGQTDTSDLRRVICSLVASDARRWQRPAALQRPGALQRLDRLEAA